MQEELCKRLGVQSHTVALMRLQHALWQLQLGMRGEVVLHGDLLRTGAMTRLCDVLGMAHGFDSLARIYGEIESLYSRYTALHELPAAEAMRLASAYQQYKSDNDLLDYDDLLVLAYMHLNGGRYCWIEVDEVQDLNALQLALIDRLATDDATIVYLGDEQQAIFSFIGAKMETLDALKRRCGNNIHHLHTNYRSPRYLLDLQNDYAVRNLNIDRNLLPSTDNDVEYEPEDLCLLNVGDAQLEAYYTARFAKRYGEIDNGRVAILVSTNREADEVGEAMNTMGVSHFKISGTDLFSLPAVRMIMAHISVKCDETVFIAWARLLWGLGITATYTAARAMMRDMRRVALLPSDLLLYPDSSYLQEFVRVYDNEELVIFDTETTGLDPKTDDIIQIAAVRVRQGRVVGKPFNVILETERELPAYVGGNPNPMIEVYRSSKHTPRAEGLLRFMEYCGSSVLVGHNVEYDYQILKNNLSRECAGISLSNRYFDTLKYIRLVRPRLRRYKLVHLIETLHLEGQNSHRADDDILATLSLLNFCHTAAMQMVADQRLFVLNRQRQVDLFRQRYADIYCHSGSTGIVDELKYVYGKLMERKMISPIEKWPHLLHYIEADLVRGDLYPDMRSQLERYVTDLCTSKEADMCGGSLQERYIISTVHKAKGLEFDTVIVYHAIDGSYPGQRSWTDKQIQEDARRLFVALSRSRRRLCVIYDSHYNSTPHVISPFLEKVKSHFTHFYRQPDGKIRSIVAR